MNYMDTLEQISRGLKEEGGQPSTNDKVLSSEVVLSKNIIQFRNKFVNLKDSKQNNRQMAMSVVSELMQFGYLLNEEAINNISSASKEDISQFHNELVSYLKIMTSSNRSYTPFWKGFPQEVMSKTELELWQHQIVHYLSNGEYEPNGWTRERKVAFEQSKYTIVSYGDEKSFLNIFTKLVSVNNSLTPDDMSIVEWFANSEYKLVFPKTIPFKENLCTLASIGLDVPINTVTDVLRIATHMSGGDISLPRVAPKLIRVSSWTTERVENPFREEFKFKKFKRKERRYILELLEKTNCDASEATLKEQRWVRLGEILHPGEYKAKFPKAFSMFNKIRNEKVDSWYSKVDKSFHNSFQDGIDKLSERPGELFRRLDSLIRNNCNSHLPNRKDIIFNAIKKVSNKVSNKVLFEVYEHFGKRNVDSLNRTIMIKGSRGITRLKDLKALDKKLINEVQNTILKSLFYKFSKLPKFDTVWVDENLKNIPMPKNMRSLSSALKPTIRGQRTPIGNKNSKVIRAFIHWFDEKGNQDLDLTGTFIGDSEIMSIGWNGHKSCQSGCYSGDVRNRMGACAEYIDINVQKSLQEGFKYVVLDVKNYNGSTFSSVKDAVAGYMEREFPESNMNFLPSTISDCTRLENESSSTIMSVIDLETREYIHLDIDTDGIPVSSANTQAMLDAIEPYCKPPSFSVYDLIIMHVESRYGTLVKEKDAKTKFNYDDYSESYIETLTLMGV